MTGDAPARPPLPLDAATRRSPSEALDALGSAPDGLSETEAAERLLRFGANAVAGHGARMLFVLARQLDNPLLILLGVATLVSFATGERVDALIIFAIVALSIGLGFVNEFRSERAVAALHDRIRHEALAWRDGRPTRVDVTALVPGDVVGVACGDVVPADLRLLEAEGLECDEAVLTGESSSVTKTVAAGAEGDPACALFMGTVVKAGRGRGVVVQTGTDTRFGRIAVELGRRPPETAFQRGLRDFSRLLVHVTVVLAASIFSINLLVRRPLLDSALFVLAIAVGLTPELLPAIVTVSLALGARRLAERSVVVKRLVTIEDLGNVEVLFTDKTGTLTEGELAFVAALDARGEPSERVLRLGLGCHDGESDGERLAGGTPLDRALWDAARGVPKDWRRSAVLPFDYERRRVSVLADASGEPRTLITKGAPEAVLAACTEVPAAVPALLERELSAGRRVLAVATRAAVAQDRLAVGDERDLVFAGLLVFADPPKASAGNALGRLARLGIEVKIVTGDHDRVARKVCADLGLDVRGVLTGTEVAALSDGELTDALPRTTIFARVTPEQKSRVIRAQRSAGADVAFLGDGVNDAIALHDADVGISVDSASDVAKDAADIVLLRKDLAVIADGVVEGRRTFANTIKYVLMGTSSNFGNMFSAAGASLFLPFLPMLPTQILLNNLLYDVSELTIPTDRVDEELLERPAHWDTGFIRRFMTFFGPISSLYDFLTFAVMLGWLHAGPELFHTGWFIESLATQTLVIFVIRTRRVPFARSRPSGLLTATTLGCVLLGVMLPFTPLAPRLGFTAPPLAFLGVLAIMVVTYLGLVQLAVASFFHPRAAAAIATEPSERRRRVHRLAMRWSLGAPRGR